MTLHIPAKVLIQVWSYDFYDMTLSTAKQRRHMINLFIRKYRGFISYHRELAIPHLCHLVGKPTMWFLNRSDTNWPVQAQKRARSLKFRILVEEELYYPSSENKGADQLRGYHEADLHLCFRICRLLVFS